ncbi:outer envelope protein 61-like isoform X2 [Asparagus officinalis]|uniref:outer envelope protein 61-like isoform X2 n=1 Tax=Asparagus officinalis TaxID=4686 RepID=UPI00098E3F3D|nr:outer envelope protein 61-like isoform X2 [Asparagus officinalis]
MIRVDAINFWRLLGITRLIQMMSNPELIRLASESMKNLRPDDLKRAAEQLKHTRPEDMVEISEKVAKAKPEEIAAMKAHADAQVSYEMSAAQMLKLEGNKLHGRGQYHEASNKYLLAKNNLKGIPSAEAGTLQLQCSLNLMSCYLKTRQFEDCIQEGSEVLAFDSKNVKALYRRGQAYKELGKLEASVSDLRKAHEISPEDETIAEVFRDANEKLMEGGDQNTSRGVVIEEIDEEETSPIRSESHETSSAECSVAEPVEAAARNYGPNLGVSPSEAECLKSLRDSPEAMRLFQNYVSNANPDTLAAMGAGGMPPDMIKTATDMITKMKPEDLQKMLEVASSLNGKSPNFPNIHGGGSKFGSQMPEMTPEMIKMASDKMCKMSPEEIQKMLKIASSMNPKGTPLPNAATTLGSQIPEMTPEMVKMASDKMSSMSPEELQKMFEVASSMNLNGAPFSNSSSDSTTQTSGSGSRASTAEGKFNDGEVIAQASSSTPASSTDLQESLRNSMKDPAMRQMFTSMMKNISPEMMANMSEQYGMKLSKEDAEKVQKTMSSLSPEDLDKMMRWAERAQRGVETVKKTKNWLLGRPGLIFAVIMLVLAFIFHRWLSTNLIIYGRADSFAEKVHI